MTLKIQDGGTLRTITSLKVRQSGITRPIKTLKVMDNGTLRTVANFGAPLTGATASPSAVSGVEASVSTVLVNSNASTALPTGGTSPFTYAWSQVSGDASVNAGFPSNASTAFNSNISSGGSKFATFQCVVTDAFGETATTNTVTVTLQNSGGGGGGGF